jgi:GT2 family glycosyltransferase
MESAVENAQSKSIISSATTKLLSIIIVNYNSGDLLLRTAQSMIESSYPSNRIELLIVDNNSHDNSLEKMRIGLADKIRELHKFTIIKNDENKGWCKAINSGLEAAQGDIIIFSNHDVIYSKHAIAKIVSYIQTAEDIGICQFNSILPSGEPDVAASYLDPMGYAYSFLVSKPTLVSFGEAVAIAVKREVINRIGYLDEDYFIEYEDQDYCWRALLHGFKILFVPDAIVTHYRGSVEKSLYFNRQKQES